MTKLYGVSDKHRVVAEELVEIKQKYEEDLLHKDVSYFEMFTAPRMPYRIAVGVGLQALQQLTGANYFFYYGTVIFQSTGINNPYVTQMILGGVNFGTCSSAPHCLTKLTYYYRHNLSRSLYGRALRPSQIPHRWCILDVCMLYDLCVR